jgi:hypothetical protein
MMVVTWEVRRKKLLWTVIRYRHYPRFCLEGLRKTSFWINGLRAET